MNKTIILPSFIFAMILLAGCSRPPSGNVSMPEIGSTRVSSMDGMSMVYVPEGRFIMGSEFGLTDEQPQHEVFLDAYWIDLTEVSNGMYRQCVADKKCDNPESTIFFDDTDYRDHPAVFVSWEDAQNYCARAGRRLPTEAEWEKAAIWDPNTNEQRTYPWGEKYDCRMGNFDDELSLDASIMPDTNEGCDGFVGSAPAGSFPESTSPYGALDMGGNVWEWVHDAFIEVDPLGSSVQNYYAISPDSNPQGVDPEITVYRVVRGGSWSTMFGFGRGAYRLWYGLDEIHDDVGFRCALPAAP